MTNGSIAGERTDAHPASARTRAAYAAARRHSSRVRLLKRVIPVGAAAAVLLVLGVMIFNPFGPAGVNLSLGPLSLSGTKITMEAPRLSGYRSKDARPYEVRAVSATQDVRKPNVVELQQMRARMAIDDKGGFARLEAATGVFDSQKEFLDLRENVRVTTDDGQEVLLRSAAVDLKAGTVVSREPVTVTMTNGTIAADGLEVGDNGKVISFIGRVRTQFAPPPPSDEPAPTPVASAALPPSGAPEAPSAVPARTSRAEPLTLRP